jgi:hypothetical protein
MSTRLAFETVAAERPLIEKLARRARHRLALVIVRTAQGSERRRRF